MPSTGRNSKSSPARLLEGIPCPLAGRGPDDVNMVFVRENTKGSAIAERVALSSRRPQT